MPWLVGNGKVLATLEVQTSWRGRNRGLLGRDGIDGAILLRPVRVVHTFRMRFPIDVAFCDRDLTVIKVLTVHRNRITRPVFRAHSVIECEAGALRKWDVEPGTHLEARGVDEPRPRRRFADRLRRPVDDRLQRRAAASRVTSREPTGR